LESTISRTANQRRTKRRFAAAIIVVSTLIVIAIVLVPVFLIMPFRPQSARSMEISYWMRRWSPYLTLIISAINFGLLIWLWPGARWWRKGLLAIGLVITFALTWLARQNHFEWMFNPLPVANYAKAREASFIKDDDRVMAIQIGGEAVAYPIRLMAYHHVVSDTVGGVHVVATY
jgi:hypothetical protein